MCPLQNSFIIYDIKIDMEDSKSYKENCKINYVLLE